MKHTSPQQNNTLGCYFQSALGAVLLLAVFVFGLDVFAGAVNPSPDSREAVVREAVAVEPTIAPTVEAVEPTAVPPTTTPIPPTATLVPPTTEPTAAEVVQAADTGSTLASEYDPAVIADGQTVYSSLCVACHGADARGLPNLGKDLVASEFVHSLTDDELLDFIKTGRPIWDPANTSGIDMPPKGGNPALSDEQILHIIAYLRSLG